MLLADADYHTFTLSRWHWHWLSVTHTDSDIDTDRNYSWGQWLTDWLLWLLPGKSWQGRAATTPPQGCAACVWNKNIGSCSPPRRPPSTRGTRFTTATGTGRAICWTRLKKMLLLCFFLFSFWYGNRDAIFLLTLYHMPDVFGTSAHMKKPVAWNTDMRLDNMCTVTSREASAFKNVFVQIAECICTNW